MIPAAASLVAIALVVALNVGDSAEQGVRGEVTLTETQSGPGREALARVQITPADAAEDANWVTALAWQGGERLHLEHLEESAPGVYRTAEPLPLNGSWKTLIRIHSGDSLIGLPIYLPKDSAIPVAAVPAPPHFERAFVDETEILQRELKDDVPSYLAAVAYTVVGLIVLSIILLLGWVLVRLGRAPATTPEAPAPRRTQRGGPVVGRPGAAT